MDKQENNSNNEKTKDKIDKKCQMLPILKTQKAEYVCPEAKDGSIYIGEYIYSKEVLEWNKMFYSLGLLDRNYQKKLNLKDKNIDTLTRDEILTRITIILRADHFCSGVLAHELENGNLEKLTKRLNKLTK